MNFQRLASTAAVLLAFTQAAAAQSATATARTTTATPGVVATVDVSRLPIDLQRIERRFRQGEFREERNGLNLRYFVEVYGKAPNIVLFTKEDNIEHGLAPFGPPTHREMLDMITPREFRSIGGINLLNPSGKSDKK